MGGNAPKTSKTELKTAEKTGKTRQLSWILENQNAKGCKKTPCLSERLDFRGAL